MIELSRRERQVAALVAEGLSNRSIASRLFIAERTAEYHVEQIRNKLGVHSRTEIAASVREHDQVGPGRIRAGNLPVQLTSFIGRDAELAELRPLLGRARLVTLVGPGGVGKTRLAIKLAAGLSWPDGAWLVDLSEVFDGELVLAEIARASEVPEEPGTPLAGAIASHLATKASLLLLDSCEHQVQPVAGIITEVLRQCQGVRILATSREPLGVPGEVTWPVPTLPLPGPSEGDWLEQVRASDAVRLFVERARLARPSFVLDQANAAVVAELTRRLDGIPLAIELAAARMLTMSPAEILEHMHERFRLLAGGGRAPVPRQRTLRATLDWSFGLLAPAERTVFRRLAVFAGGFSPEAAAMVCGDPSQSDGVWDQIGRLVEKSIVQREERAARSRYRLLDTMREFALEQAYAVEELAVARRRHAAFFVALAEEAAPHLNTPDQAAWLDRLEDEEDNLRAALDWLADEAPGTCLRMAAALRWFWTKRNRFSEGVRRALRALQQDSVPSVARGRLLVALARFELWSGGFAAASAHVEEGVHTFRQLGDGIGLAEALTWFGAIRHVGMSDPTGALSLSEEAAQLARAAGDLWALGQALNGVGLHMLAMGRAAEARSVLEEAVACARSGGDDWSTAKVIESLAEAALATGDRKLAATAWAEGLQMSAAYGPVVNAGWCLLGLAQLAAPSDPARALRLAAGGESVLHGEGWVLGQVEAAILEGRQAEAWRGLPPDNAASAWREGAAMTLAELVRYALTEPLLEPGARTVAADR